MIRALHRWPGLLALLLVTILALSGAALSVFPMAERLASPQAGADQSLAQLSQRVLDSHPGLEQIRRAPSGRITAWWFENGTPGSAVIDPATGLNAASADPNQTQRWLTNLHRSLFLGDGGRLVMAAGAVSMALLAISGMVLVARRTGGWRRWLSPMHGPFAGRLHVEIARLAVPLLALSALTALWMTASTFGFLPDEGATAPFPAAVSGQTGIRPEAIELLRQTPVSDLRELSFPAATDARDVYSLTTSRGSGYLDQGTGALLGWADRTTAQRLSELIYTLHTGQGAALLGLMLGLAALTVPVLGVTGLVLWLGRPRASTRIRGNARAAQAETVILVGSEGGTTWSFAATLHRALTAAGQSVHVAPMSGFDPKRHAAARRFLILAATYGDGTAPQSARGFLDRLGRSAAPTGVRMAVLGFGDRSFPGFCAYGEDVARAASARGWTALLPFDTVDRQSPQDFARWGRALGASLGIELVLDHQPVRPESQALRLISRRDYGADMQAPTAILRFALPQQSHWQRLTGRGRFRPGDLLGVLPQGGDGQPRFYSLASGSRDGFVEIVVRKHPGGLCSGQLMSLEPGDSMEAFLRANPGFRAGRGRAPLILIGAGTGIGPLAGFVRANDRHRPIHLFFGMRHKDSDFLYGKELAGWQADGRLTRLSTATSRGSRPHYVQDVLRSEAAEVARLARNGARVMVCGGREMAAGVAEALTDILAPAGLSPVALKAEGRYAEDIY
jgi:sulfite reductase (NADPH) flavoprotein alpha-component